MSEGRRTRGELFDPTFGAGPTIEALSDRASVAALLEVRETLIPADQTTTTPARPIQVGTLRPNIAQGGTHE